MLLLPRFRLRPSNPAGMGNGRGNPAVCLALPFLLPCLAQAAASMQDDSREKSG